MLLSNLTAASAACSALLSLNVTVISESASHAQPYPTQSRCGTCTAPVPYPSGDPREVLALPLLVDAFVHGAQIDPTADPTTRKRRGELHFLSSVFANLTVVRALVRQDTLCANTVIVDTKWPLLLSDSSICKCYATKRRLRISSSETRGVHRAQRYHTERRGCCNSEVSQLNIIKSGFSTFCTLTGIARSTQLRTRLS